MLNLFKAFQSDDGKASGTVLSYNHVLPPSVNKYSTR